MDFTFKHTDGSSTTVTANNKEQARDKAMRVKHGESACYPRGGVQYPAKPWLKPPYQGLGLTLV